MKTAEEVLLNKELELEKVKEEVEALRIAAQLLREREDASPAPPRKRAKVLRMPS